MKVLDLFSGIGGISLGLHNAGFETVAFCEFDADARKVLEKNFPKIPIFEDVKELHYLPKYKALVDGRGDHYYETKIDMIAGGFPYTDISVAGKGKGLRDEKLYEYFITLGMAEDEANEESRNDRSGLWFQFRRLIEEIRPKYVLIENVANLRSKGLVVVLQNLDALGYDSEWHVISARHVGAPHLRERIFIIAYRRVYYSDSDSDRRVEGVSIQAKNERESLQSFGIGPKRRIETPNSDGERLEGRNVSRGGGEANGEKRISRSSAVSLRGGIKTPDSDNIRFGGALTSEEEKSEWWAKNASRFRSMFERLLKTEPAIRRSNYGLPSRLDERRREQLRKARIKQLGNSVVPPIIQLIGEAIKDYENGKIK